MRAAVARVEETVEATAAAVRAEAMEAALEVVVWAVAVRAAARAVTWAGARAVARAEARAEAREGVLAAAASEVATVRLERWPGGARGRPSIIAPTTPDHHCYSGTLHGVAVLPLSAGPAQAGGHEERAGNARSGSKKEECGRPATRLIAPRLLVSCWSSSRIHTEIERKLTCN